MVAEVRRARWYRSTVQQRLAAESRPAAYILVFEFFFTYGEEKSDTRKKKPFSYYSKLGRDRRINRFRATRRQLRVEFRFVPENCSLFTLRFPPTRPPSPSSRVSTDAQHSRRLPLAGWRCPIVLVLSKNVQVTDHGQIRSAHTRSRRSRVCRGMTRLAARRSNTRNCEIIRRASRTR